MSEQSEENLLIEFEKEISTRDDLIILSDYNHIPNFINKDNFFNSLLAINVQEYSRKCMKWELIEFEPEFFKKLSLTKHFNKLDNKIEEIIPKTVRNLISKYNLVLSGGFMSSSITKDYDLFYIKNEKYTLMQIISELKKQYNFLESYNAVSFFVKKRNKKIKIDIVKRIYNQLDHILGGFDLDCCRVAFYNNKIYTMHSYLFSVKTEMNYININCQSLSFVKRIGKYRTRGFINYDIHSYNNSNYDKYILKYYPNSDYIFIGKNYYIDIITALIKKEYNKFYYKNKIITFEQLWKGFFESGKFYDEDKYYETRQLLKLFIKHNYKKNIYFNGKFYEYNEEQQEINKLINKIKLILEKRFNQNYEKYCLNINAQNPTSQFTGSNFPTNLTIDQIYKNPCKINFLKYIPEILIIFVGIKKRFYETGKLIGLRFVKYFYNVVMKFYFLDKLNNELDTFPF